MSNSKSTSGLPTMQAIQNPDAVDVCRKVRPVGVIVHAHGLLRLFRDPASDRLVAEVVGFRTAHGRDFLELLDELPDITSEVLVADAPSLYPLDGAPVRDRHARRHV